MAQHRVPSGVDPVDFLLRENANLANRVQSLEGRRKSTWDRDDYTSVAAPVEGQHHVDASDEAIRYYSNGAWRTVGGHTIEWMTAAVNNMSLGTSLTAIDWGASPGGEFDAITPTFAVNASNNIEIGKGGVYVVDIDASGWTLTASVNSNLLLEYKRIAGASGQTADGLFNTANGCRHYVILHGDLADVDFDNDPAPTVSFQVAISQASIDGGGACEMQVRAYIEEDGSGVAHAEGDWGIMISRLGAQYGNA